jgi:hypothetical protein
LKTNARLFYSRHVWTMLMILSRKPEVSSFEQMLKGIHPVLSPAEL